MLAIVRLSIAAMPYQRRLLVTTGVVLLVAMIFALAASTSSVAPSPSAMAPSGAAKATVDSMGGGTAAKARDHLASATVTLVAVVSALLGSLARAVGTALRPVIGQQRQVHRPALQIAAVSHVPPETTVLESCPTPGFRMNRDVLAFLEATYDFDPASRVAFGEMYTAYQSHCRVLGQKPVSRQTMGTTIANLGVERRLLEGRPFYVGFVRKPVLPCRLAA